MRKEEEAQIWKGKNQKLGCQSAHRVDYEDREVLINQGWVKPGQKELIKGTTCTQKTAGL